MICEIPRNSGDMRQPTSDRQLATSVTDGKRAGNGGATHEPANVQRRDHWLPDGHGDQAASP